MLTNNAAVARRYVYVSASVMHGNSASAILKSRRSPSAPEARETFGERGLLKFSSSIHNVSVKTYEIEKLTSYITRARAHTEVLRFQKCVLFRGFENKLYNFMPGQRCLYNEIFSFEKYTWRFM